MTWSLRSKHRKIIEVRWLFHRASHDKRNNCPNEGAMASNREIFRPLQKEWPGEFFYEVDGDDGDVDVSVDE